MTANRWVLPLTFLGFFLFTVLDPKTAKSPPPALPVSKAVRISFLTPPLAPQRPRSFFSTRVTPRLYSRQGLLRKLSFSGLASWRGGRRNVLTGNNPRVPYHLFMGVFTNFLNPLRSLFFAAAPCLARTFFHPFGSTFFLTPPRYFLVFHTLQQVPCRHFLNERSPYKEPSLISFSPACRR